MAMDSVPRISRAVARRVKLNGEYRGLSRVANAHEFGRFTPGKSPPRESAAGEVMVIGAELWLVLRLSARQTAQGAIVAFDTRPEVKSGVQSMG